MRAKESLAYGKTEKSFPNDYVPVSSEQSSGWDNHAISGRKTDSELISVSIGFNLSVVTNDIISIL